MVENEKVGSICSQLFQCGFKELWKPISYCQLELKQTDCITTE